MVGIFRSRRWNTFEKREKERKRERSRERKNALGRPLPAKGEVDGGTSGKEFHPREASASRCLLEPGEIKP